MMHMSSWAAVHQAVGKPLLEQLALLKSPGIELHANTCWTCTCTKRARTVAADLERVCGPDCILSTNTSTIDIELIGSKTKSQDRVIGAHFFSPAHIMPLLEIVRTSKTSKQVCCCLHPMCICAVWVTYCCLLWNVHKQGCNIMMSL